MGTWESSEEGKKYRNEFKKKNYDVLYVNLPKGLKELFTEELKIDEKGTAEFITDAIKKYLKSKDYTDKDIENYIEQARKKAEN